MSYNTDKTKFSLPMNSGTKKRSSQDETGWDEYAKQDGYSLQVKEVKKGTTTVWKYRKVQL